MIKSFKYLSILCFAMKKLKYDKTKNTCYVNNKKLFFDDENGNFEEE